MHEPYTSNTLGMGGVANLFGSFAPKKRKKKQNADQKMKESLTKEWQVQSPVVQREKSIWLMVSVAYDSMVPENKMAPILASKNLVYTRLVTKIYGIFLKRTMTGKMSISLSFHDAHTLTLWHLSLPEVTLCSKCYIK